MKTSINLLLIFCLVLSGFNRLHAQTLQTLDQVKLIKQFAGTWQAELGNDTIVIGTNTVFGTGLACNSDIVVKGKVINSVKQLYGYDPKADKFIVAELIKTSPAVEICETWFTSPTSGETVITNPGNRPVKYIFEFRSANEIVQRAILEGKVIKEIVIKRVGVKK